ncbi:hypothetical protein KIPB_005598, partial [Kipferlia bialata]
IRFAACIEAIVLCVAVADTYSHRVRKGMLEPPKSTSAVAETPAPPTKGKGSKASKEPPKDVIPVASGGPTQQSSLKVCLECATEASSYLAVSEAGSTPSSVMSGLGDCPLTSAFGCTVSCSALTMLAECLTRVDTSLTGGSVTELIGMIGMAKTAASASLLLGDTSLESLTAERDRRLELEAAGDLGAAVTAAEGSSNTSSGRGSAAKRRGSAKSKSHAGMATPSNSDALIPALQDRRVLAGMSPVTRVRTRLALCQSLFLGACAYKQTGSVYVEKTGIALDQVIQLLSSDISTVPIHSSRVGLIDRTCAILTHFTGLMLSTLKSQGDAYCISGISRHSVELVSLLDRCLSDKGDRKGDQAGRAGLREREREERAQPPGHTLRCTSDRNFSLYIAVVSQCLMEAGSYASTRALLKRIPVLSAPMRSVLIKCTLLDAACVPAAVCIPELFPEMGVDVSTSSYGSHPQSRGLSTSASSRSVGTNRTRRHPSRSISTRPSTQSLSAHTTSIETQGRGGETERAMQDEQEQEQRKRDSLYVTAARLLFRRALEKRDEAVCQADLDWALKCISQAKGLTQEDRAELKLAKAEIVSYSVAGKPSTVALLVQAALRLVYPEYYTLVTAAEGASSIEATLASLSSPSGLVSIVKAVTLLHKSGLCEEAGVRQSDVLPIVCHAVTRLVTVLGPEETPKDAEAEAEAEAETPDTSGKGLVASIEGLLGYEQTGEEDTGRLSILVPLVDPVLDYLASLEAGVNDPTSVVAVCLPLLRILQCVSVPHPSIERDIPKCRVILEVIRHGRELCADTSVLMEAVWASSRAAERDFFQVRERHALLELEGSGDDQKDSSIAAGREYALVKALLVLCYEACRTGESGFGQEILTVVHSVRENSECETETLVGVAVEALFLDTYIAVSQNRARDALLRLNEALARLHFVCEGVDVASNPSSLPLSLHLYPMIIYSAVSIPVLLQEPKILTPLYQSVMRIVPKRAPVCCTLALNTCQYRALLAKVCVSVTTAYLNVVSVASTNKEPVTDTGMSDILPSQKRKVVSPDILYKLRTSLSLVQTLDISRSVSSLCLDPLSLVYTPCMTTVTGVDADKFQGVQTSIQNLVEFSTLIEASHSVLVSQCLPLLSRVLLCIPTYTPILGVGELDTRPMAYRHVLDARTLAQGGFHRCTAVEGHGDRFKSAMAVLLSCCDVRIGIEMRQRGEYIAAQAQNPIPSADTTCTSQLHSPLDLTLGVGSLAGTLGAGADTDSTLHREGDAVTHWLLQTAQQSDRERDYSFPECLDYLGLAELPLLDTLSQEVQTRLDALYPDNPLSALSPTVTAAAKGKGKGALTLPPCLSGDVSLHTACLTLMGCANLTALPLDREAEPSLLDDFTLPDPPAPLEEGQEPDVEAEAERAQEMVSTLQGYIANQIEEACQCAIGGYPSQAYVDKCVEACQVYIERVQQGEPEAGSKGGKGKGAGLLPDISAGLTSSPAEGEGDATPYAPSESEFTHLSRCVSEASVSLALSLAVSNVAGCLLPLSLLISAFTRLPPSIHEPIVRPLADLYATLLHLHECQTLRVYASHSYAGTTSGVSPVEPTLLADLQTVTLSCLGEPVSAACLLEHGIDTGSEGSDRTTRLDTHLKALPLSAGLVQYEAPLVLQTADDSLLPGAATASEGEAGTAVSALVTELNTSTLQTHSAALASAKTLLATSLVGCLVTAWQRPPTQGGVAHLLVGVPFSESFLHLEGAKVTMCACGSRETLALCAAYADSARDMELGLGGWSGAEVVSKTELQEREAAKEAEKQRLAAEAAALKEPKGKGKKGKGAPREGAATPVQPPASLSPTPAETEAAPEVVPPLRSQTLQDALLIPLLPVVACAQLMYPSVMPVLPPRGEGQGDKAQEGKGKDKGKGQPSSATALTPSLACAPGYIHDMPWELVLSVTARQQCRERETELRDERQKELEAKLEAKLAEEAKEEAEGERVATTLADLEAEAEPLVVPTLTVSLTRHVPPLTVVQGVTPKPQPPSYKAMAVLVDPSDRLTDRLIRHRKSQTASAPSSQSRDQILAKLNREPANVLKCGVHTVLGARDQDTGTAVLSCEPLLCSLSLPAALGMPYAARQGTGSMLLLDTCRVAQSTIGGMAMSCSAHLGTYRPSAAATGRASSRTSRVMQQSLHPHGTDADTPTLTKWVLSNPVRQLQYVLTGCGRASGYAAVESAGVVAPVAVYARAIIALAGVPPTVDKKDKGKGDTKGVTGPKVTSLDEALRYEWGDGVWSDGVIKMVV